MLIGIDVAHFERIDKDLRVEIGANILALGGGVKIEVNLAETVLGRHQNSPYNRSGFWEKKFEWEGNRDQCITILSSLGQKNIVLVVSAASR